jgi:hypothetical protein
MKTKRIFLVMIFAALAFFAQAQSLTVSGITTSGHFNTCSAGLPVITATLLQGTGSVVNNGSLACMDATGSSTIRIAISNIRWDKTVTNNWIHGIFFLAPAEVLITNVQLPPGWIFLPQCTGSSCSAGITGGPGFYYDGTALATCCVGTVNDGNAGNNFGDAFADCNNAYTVNVDIKIMNNVLNGNPFLVRLRGSSDGATGCWNQPDPSSSLIQFRFETSSCLPIEKIACNPIASGTLTTTYPSLHYQWSMSTDSITYNVISDNAIFSGTATNTLTLTNVPSSYYGSRFKCSPVSNVYTLRFVNTWTGTINSDWGNPGNWSCGTVPDGNTDAIINSGTVIVGANSSVRSLTLQPGVIFTVNTGVTFTITH